ncbi:MAG: FAD-dependent oxidoreductase [Ktedonobacteraceae bacterium]
MMKQHYDVLIIGAGAAGSTAATVAAEQGVRVALIERDEIGGTCLNYGCDPTKTLLFIADLLYQTQHARRYGLHIPTASVRWGEVQTYVQHIINTMRGGTTNQAQKQMKKSGIDVFRGEARFTSAHEIMVTSTQEDHKVQTEETEETKQTISAERILIAVGNETVIPPIDGLQQVGFITNVEAVALPSLPARLAILGGGAIGIEFAQMFRRFGVDVTVLEHGSSLLSKEDSEVANILVDLLHKEGLRTETGAELIRMYRADDGKHLLFRNQEGAEEELVVDEILLAIGRKPALEALNLEAAGIKTEKHGISVDAALRTNVPHIWAAGDVVGDYQFTHFATEQGNLVAHNMFAEQPQPFGDRIVPWVTYTNPPLAHVGKTEEELREAGVEYKVGRMHFKEVERAIAQDETEGLVKLLVSTQGKILGGHILGARADDLLAPLVVAMQADLPVQTLATTILPYPPPIGSVPRAAESIK